MFLIIFEKFLTLIRLLLLFIFQPLVISNELKSNQEKKKIKSDVGKT